MRETHEIFQEALPLLNHCVVVVDKDLNIVGGNRQDLQAIMDHLENFSLSCCDFFCPGEPLSCRPCVVRAVFESGQPIKIETFPGQSGPFEVEAFPIFEPAGEVAFVGKQISLRSTRKIEQQLRESEERFREMADCLPQTVFEADPLGRLTFTNKFSLEQFGYSREAFDAGINMFQVVAPQNRAKALNLAQRVLRGEKEVSGEIEALRSNGSTFPALVYGSPIVKEGRVTGLRGMLMDITPLKDAFRRLHQSELRFQHLAQHDSLTGLPNRRLLMDRLNHAIAKSRRFKRSLAVFVVNVDKFRKINDSLGYETGGKVLHEIAERLRAMVREADTLAKLCSDEFVIVCEEIKSREKAALVAQQVVDLLSTPLTVSGYMLHLSVSVGIALLDDDWLDAESFLRAADIAMNEARKRGGKRYMFFSRDMEDRAKQVFRIEEQLRRALEKENLHLVYQPQIDLATGKTVGVEALARLGKTQDAGTPPDEFIPVAENSGLIFPLGDWVLEKACAQNRLWLESGLSPLTVTVNLSPKQFSQPDFVEKVVATLNRTGLPPRWLEFEITESALMEDISHAIFVMKKLRNLGVSFTIDDFGKGFSSLTHLRYLPLSKLKIDRSFVKQVPENSLDVKLVHSVLALARSFDLKTVVEGIETRQQFQFFKNLKCDMAQGYLFGRPVLPEEIPSCFGKIF